MFGLRYHIVTVVSMLLMLGIGFWFGATSSFGPNIVKSQTKTLSKLNGTLNNMLQDDDHDRALLRANQDAVSALTPGLVESKLAHKRVALVQLGDYPAAGQAAAQAIGNAGGSVVSTMIVNNRLSLLPDDKRRQLAGPSESLSVLYRSLAVAFRAGTTNRPDAQAGLDSLQDSDLISYSGDVSQPVSAVVVVGGWDDDPTEVASDGSADQSAPQAQTISGAASGGGISNSDNEVGLIGALVNGGSTPLVVVGCESSDAAFSSVPDFLKANISSVDCVDLPIGALDLPFALLGQRGAYGIKSESALLVPNSLRAAAAQAQ